VRVSLRVKVILVALVLSVIPLVGYLHVMEMERLLREGQEQALLATARAIATALHDRPQLLDVRPGRPASGEMQLILKSLARADSRIWIVDRNQQLLAIAGARQASPLVHDRHRAAQARTPLRPRAGAARARYMIAR